MKGNASRIDSCGCPGFWLCQVPKSYQWDSVDCVYQRGIEGLQRDEVRADCKLKGRVEFLDIGSPF